MSDSRKRLCTLLFAVLVAFTSVRPVHAQLLFGSIVGNVTDASGAAVPGATVTVTQLETNESRETKTSDAGSFTLSTVHTGTYNVAVAKDGFKSYSAQNVVVRVNTEVRVDASLQVGSQSQSVEVTAESAALQTDRSDTHTEFTNQQMTDLPQPTRTFEGIAMLTPGMTPAGASSGGNNNPSKSYSIRPHPSVRSQTFKPPYPLSSTPTDFASQSLPPAMPISSQVGSVQRMFPTPCFLSADKRCGPGRFKRAPAEERCLRSI